MQCRSPRTVGFTSDGKLAWSQRDLATESVPFKLPCGKCIECRLEYARQWAVRCVHEAATHEKNSFITLTYSDKNLKSPKLIYEDFQKFMKRLRYHNPENQLGVFVTGEYGEITKRPHWHAIIFGYWPKDAEYFRSNERGDKIYKSKSLEEQWSHGHAELGTVTFESAGYVARYAAKKLVHGKDDEHEFQPISKKSNKHAIGKKWLERFWPDVFNHGKLILRNGTETSIPRYYEKWLKENEPDAWLRYVTQVKYPKINKAEIKALEEEIDQIKIVEARDFNMPYPMTRKQVKSIIMDQKFEQLQSKLKLK